MRVFVVSDIHDEEIAVERIEERIGKKDIDEVHNRAHIGSESIRKIIEEKKPFAAFFGHVHEHAGTERLGNTRLVKIPAAKDRKACIAETNSRELSIEFVSL